MNWWYRVLLALFVGSVSSTALETVFTQSFHDARAAELAATGPVLILGGGHARIYQHGALQDTIQMNLTQYHFSKLYVWHISQ